MAEQSKTLKRTSVAIAALILIGLAGRIFFPPPPPTEGILPPDQRKTLDLATTMPTLSEKRIDLARHPGKVLVINFWATWCGPCVAEMPSLEKLNQTLAPEGLYIIGVTADPPSSARAFAAGHGITFDIASDPSTRLARRFGIIGLPDTFVIDGKGRLAMRVMGGADWADPKLIEALRKLLSES